MSTSRHPGQPGEDGDGAVDRIAVPAVGEVAHQAQRGALRLMGNLTDGRDGDTVDRTVAVLTSLARGA